MTSTLGQRMQNTATRLFNKYGDDVTFTRIIPGSFVPSTGAIQSGSTVVYFTKGISDTYNFQEVNGTTVLSSDIKFMIPITTDMPKVDDTVIINDLNYRVMQVSIYDLQNLNIMYILQLRL